MWCWNEPQEWPPRGTKEERQELAKILASRMCSSLQDKDILVWGPDLKYRFFVASGYMELDR